MFGKLFRDAGGGISIAAALILVPLIGMTAFAVEFGQGYNEYAQAQKVADMAALSAGLAFRNAGGTLDKVSIVVPTARAVAVANGIPISNVDVFFRQNYSGAGQHAIEVTVRKAVPLRLAHVLTSAVSYTVKAKAIAALASPMPPPCMIALAGGDSISALNSTQLSADDCSIAANGNMVVSSSTQVTANTIGLGGSVNSAGGVVTTNPDPDRIYQNRQTPAADPLADNSNVRGALTILGHVRASSDWTVTPDTPSGSVTWSDWRFDPSNESPSVASFRTGPSTYVVPTYVNRTIDNLYVAPNVTVTFQPKAVYIRNGVINQGTLIFQGPASPYAYYRINVTGGINHGTSAGGPIIFGDHIQLQASGSQSIKLYGASRFGSDANVYSSIFSDGSLVIAGDADVVIGKGTINFKGIEVAPNGKLRIAEDTRYGYGDFLMRGEISIGSGGQMMIGSRSGYWLVHGNNSNKTIRMTGNAALLMGDGRFSSDGDIEMTGNQGHLVFGSADNQMINGDLKVEGAVLFGDAKYTINGNFTGGNGDAGWPFTSYWGTTHGDASPYSGYTIAGKNVTFVTADVIDLDNGARLNLAAPTTDGTYDGAIKELLFISNTDQPSAFGEGTTSSLNGVMYLPNADVTVLGGAGLGSVSTCFMMITKTAVVTDGAVTSKLCPSFSTAISQFLDIALIR